MAHRLICTVDLPDSEDPDLFFDKLHELAGVHGGCTWRESFAVQAELDDSGRLKCPACGNSDPEKFGHVEYAPHFRDVLRGEEGRIVFDGFYEAGEGEIYEAVYCKNVVPDGRNRRECGTELVVPDDFEIDFE